MVRVRRAWRKGVREEPAFYVLQLRHRLKSGGYGPVRLPRFDGQG
jgi:hypothetical protein